MKLGTAWIKCRELDRASNEAVARILDLDAVPSVICETCGSTEVDISGIHRNPRGLRMICPDRV